MENWSKELPFAITVCDKDGKILELNDKAGKTFAKWGGMDLLGKNLFDCHNPHSVKMIKEMMTDDKTNCYTIEKEGIKKIIYQCPWYENKEVMGMVEISIEIPFEMPHFIRK